MLWTVDPACDSFRQIAEVKMRAAFSGVSLLLLAACGGPGQAGGPGVPEVVAEAPAAERPTARIPASIADTLTIVCSKPFSQDATAGTLAELFGAADVIPETLDGPNGERRNITAIYPFDRSRRIEVTFGNEEERTLLTRVTIKGESSEWTGPGGINLGDGVASVERLNKGPFTLSGFGQPDGGYVTDWQGGVFKEIAAGCRTTVRFSLPDDVEPASAILGVGGHSSQEPAVLAAAPYVTEISISWLEEHEY